MFAISSELWLFFSISCYMLFHSKNCRDSQPCSGCTSAVAQVYVELCLGRKVKITKIIAKQLETPKSDTKFKTKMDN